MNTFGALKYLEAEQAVVEEITLDLKDQLNKVKIEELAIRAAIRSRMKQSQANAVDLNSLGQLSQNLGGVVSSTLPNTTSHQMNTRPSTSTCGPGFESGEAPVQPREPNRPIEVSINEALEMISRYRGRDFLSDDVGHDDVDQAEEQAAECDDEELDEAGMEEGTESDEPTSSGMHVGVEFLDLRNVEPGEDGTF